MFIYERLLLLEVGDSINWNFSKKKTEEKNVCVRLRDMNAGSSGGQKKVLGALKLKSQCL